MVHIQFKPIRSLKQAWFIFKKATNKYAMCFYWK